MNEVPVVVIDSLDDLVNALAYPIGVSIVELVRMYSLVRLIDLITYFMPRKVMIALFETVVTCIPENLNYYLTKNRLKTLILMVFKSSCRYFQPNYMLCYT